MFFSFVSTNSTIIQRTLEANVGPCTSCDCQVGLVQCANQLRVLALPVWTFRSHEVIYCQECDMMLTQQMYEDLCAPLLQAKIDMRTKDHRKCHRCGYSKVQMKAAICPKCKQTFLSGAVSARDETNHKGISS